LYEGSTNAVLKEYKFQGLTPGSAYKFRVYARNIIGYSAAGASTEIYAATLPPQMEAPTSGTVTPSGAASSIVINWSVPSENGGSAITGYYVQRNNGYGSSFIEPGTFIAVGTTTTTFSSLLAGATYRFRIAAVNIIYSSNLMAGDSLNFSEEISVIAANPPDAISDLAQLSSNYVSGSVKLTWSEPATNGAKITSYTIYKDIGSGTYYPLWTGLANSYTDSGLVAGQSYNYKILATNAAGDSALTSAVAGIAGALPGKITSIEKTLQSQTTLTITYAAPSETGGLSITRYWVQTDNADFTYSAAVDNGVLLTYSKTISQPGNEGKIYRFKVAAENALGIGEYSDEVQLMAADAPDAPTIALVSGSRTLTSCQLKFAPGASNGGSPLIGYRLYRDEGVSGSPFSLLYDGTGKPEIIKYKDEGLETGLSYSY